MQVWHLQGDITFQNRVNRVKDDALPTFANFSLYFELIDLIKRIALADEMPRPVDLSFATNRQAERGWRTGASADKEGVDR